LSFERIRITASIRIVTDTQFHLVACVEVSKVTRIADTQKNYRHRTMENSMPKKNCIAEKIQRLANSRGIRLFLETVKSKCGRKTASADTVKTPLATASHFDSRTAKSVQKTCAINGVPGKGSAIDFMALMP